MESRRQTTATNQGFSIEPREIVEHVVSYVEGYGLSEGQRVFEATERLMGFAPWWDSEVRKPVMKFFKEERQREKLEMHEMELDRQRAGATNVNISQPQAQAGVSLPQGAGIGQLNIGDGGNPSYYSKPA